MKKRLMKCSALRSPQSDPVDRRGVDPDEDFVLFRYGPLDFVESQNLRRPVPVVHNCFHRFIPPRSGFWS